MVANKPSGVLFNGLKSMIKEILTPFTGMNHLYKLYQDDFSGH